MAMTLINKTQKFVGSLFLLSFSLWLGGSLVRTIISYSVFSPSATQTLVRQVSNDILMQSVYLFASSTIYTLPAYLIAFACAVYFLVNLRPHFKDEGWLSMSLLLFFLSSPIQFYNGYLDIQLSMHIFWGGNWEFYSEQIQKFFFKRMVTIWNSTLSGLSYLANLTILFYIVWQPLKKNK